jgi:uncharacterized protein (UPF0332 family)
MSLNYEDYFYLAQELAGKSPTKTPSEEAKLRSAISRAYYAVFLKAREYLEYNTPLILPKDGTEHGFVREQFFALGSTDGKFIHISRSLKFLHELRKDADYAKLIDDLSRTTDSALKRAEDALKRLNTLR